MNTTHPLEQCRQHLPRVPLQTFLTAFCWTPASRGISAANNIYDVIVGTIVLRVPDSVNDNTTGNGKHYRNQTTNATSKNQTSMIHV